MFAKLLSLLLGIIWLVTGTLFLLLGATLINLINVPCFLGSPLCNTVQDTVLYQFLGGRVTVSSLQNMLFILPILVLALSVPMILSAYEHLRYSMVQNRSSIASLSLMMTAFYVLLLLFINNTLNVLLPDFVDVLREADAVNATVISFYDTLNATFRANAVIAAFTIITLTSLLLLAPDSPPEFVQKTFLNDPLQCRTCGLRGDTEIPTCILCQNYYKLAIPDEIKQTLQGQVFTADSKGKLEVKVSPIQSYLPIQRISLRLIAPNNVDITSGANTSDWIFTSATGRRNEYVMDGPAYLTDDAVLKFEFQVNSAIQNQLRREQTYPLRIVASTQNTVERREELVEITIQREQRNHERVLSQIGERTSSGLDATGKLLGDLNQQVTPKLRENLSNAIQQVRDRGDDRNEE